MIPASELKAVCLEIMDRVRETGVEYVVTKHRQPVARLVPYLAPERPPVSGSMPGTVVTHDRPLDPLDADWDINRDGVP